MMVTSLLASQAVRLLRIEKRLTVVGASMAELMAMLGASNATIKRDLVILREELGAPVVWDQSDHRYRIRSPWRGVMSHLFEHAKGAVVADFFSAPLADSGKAPPTVEAVEPDLANAVPRQLEGA